jgi:hypothetical protein
MNELFHHISYLCLSVIFLAPSILLARYLFQATQHRLLFKAGFVYNSALALAQVNFFMKGEFLFLDTFDSSYIVFLGLVFSIFHLQSIGTLRLKTCEKTDVVRAKDKSYVYALNSYLDRILFFVKWGLIILTTSAFYTAVIAYLLIQLHPEKSVDMATRITLGVSLYIILAVIGTYLAHRHHKVKRQ